MRILVLGAYGMIGQAIAGLLVASGHDVSGLGRNVSAPAARWPGITWIRADLKDMLTPADWAQLAKSHDVIVNASGVLQDGPDDNVRTSQFIAMIALFDACAEARTKLIHISAAGASTAHATDFMQTKALADEHLMHLDFDWSILRPGLVISPAAYGGTALLRALAAFPWFLPVVHGDVLLQTVHVDDVAAAVVRLAENKAPWRRIYDLVEDEPHTLRDVLIEMRQWLGYPPAVLVNCPVWIGKGIGIAADLLGRLGWRSPLRSTAITTLSQGVQGQPDAWTEVTGKPLRSFRQTLDAITSSVQERWFARMWLLKAPVTGLLAIFWLLSGMIALLKFETASHILTLHGLPDYVAAGIVSIGSCADIALGLAVLVHRWHKPALLGMIITSLAYLSGASVFAGELWLDPIGPLVKVLPSIGLATVALAIAENR